MPERHRAHASSAGWVVKGNLPQGVFERTASRVRLEQKILAVEMIAERDNGSDRPRLPPPALGGAPAAFDIRPLVLRDEARRDPHPVSSGRAP
jgi:hypothetical protein